MTASNVYELIYMSHQGDEGAFEALFRDCRNLIDNVAGSCLLGYRPLFTYREDILQEAEASLIRAVDGYREDQNVMFITFMILVVKRRVWNVMKKIFREQGHAKEMISLDSKISEDEPFYSIIEQTDPMNDPVYATRYRMASQRLEKELRSMSEREMEIVDSWLRGETYAEASKRLGITEKAYDGRKHRAMRRIRKAVLD